MTRILWLITTPRALRRRTLAALLAWIAVASAHQHGMFAGPDPVAGRLPTPAVPAESGI